MRWILMFCSLFLALPQVMEAKKHKSSKSNVSSRIKEKKDQYKKAKTKFKNKYSNAKKSIKNRLKLSLNFENLAPSEKQECYVYLATLMEEIETGSFEGYQEACDLLEVDFIEGIPEAVALIFHELERVMPKESENVFEASLCGKYIGDDGLEYDDETGSEDVVEVSFYSLPIHQWEKKVIEKIITSMAEKSLAQLLMDRKEMEKRGDQIHHVHPLRFMAHVFSDSYLKSCMSQIRNNSFKWSNLIDGYASRMREEFANRNVEKHIEGFCAFLRIDPDPVREIILAGNYEGLILHLMQL